eukprot:11221388-Lingulodinium_polyedra.AAC.1
MLMRALAPAHRAPLSWTVPMLAPGWTKTALLVNAAPGATGVPANPSVTAPCTQCAGRAHNAATSP